MKLYDKFKVDEDSAVPAIDQIYERVNWESSIDWARTNELPKKEFNDYLKGLGEDYQLTNKNIWGKNY